MNKTYISEIDVLRAVAVLSVMICHLNASWLPGGFAGVDIFFVISGYVVTKSLLDRPTDSVKTFMLDFYARRCLRILPALFLVIGLTVIATILFIPDSWLSEAVERTGLYALFGFSNHALYLFDDGYFAPRSDYNPFTHTWSLGVEEQFYLLVPLVLFLFIRAKSTKQELACIIGISVLAITSLGCAWWLSLTDPKAAYYLMPSRFWELAAGVLLALAHHSKARGSTPAWHGRAALLLGTVSLAIGLIYTDPKLFPMPWALAPVLGASLMIHGIFTADMRSMPAVVIGVMRNAVLQYIGRISYSLYLFHWPIFVLMRWTLGLESAAHYLVAIMATFVCAIASYHVLEMPIRSLGRGADIRRDRILISGGAAVLASVFVFSGLFSSRDDLTLTVTSEKSLWQARYTPRQSGYVGEDFPTSTIFAIGDSHLGAYEPMIRWAADDLEMDVRLFPTQACQLGRIYYRISQTPDCENLVAQIINEIKVSAKPGDVIFLAALRSHRLVDQWVLFDAEKISQFNASDRYLKRLHEAAEQNEKYMQEFAETGAHVLIDLPKPNLPAVPYRCADWFNRSNPICQNGLTISRARLDRLNAPMIETLRRLQETVPELLIWDPFPPLCPNATCSAFIDGKPLFYDGDHISQYGNEVLYPYFRQEIVDILAPAAPSTPTR
jgi:peptidoglycan/LPS O-acetylase OafA/YrhL